MKQFTNSYFCVMKTNSLNKIFISFFSDNNIDLETSKFLLAVSGGIDSMVMLDLFKKNNFSLFALVILVREVQNLWGTVYL